ncbi:MAG TPA: rhodanese-like domain-containing protein, partial [Casimicrobiaceae bacterium]|nr:rhodanese-like domain-containing protein [Casimicrobiaceae bacterium]
SAALWVGAAMATGAIFARQIDVALAWTEQHVAAAALVAAVLFAAYVAVKALQRWRMARLLEGAMISVDELREALAGGSPPTVIDVGSKIAQAERGHIPGAILLDLDEIATRDDFPDDRDIVLYCECPNEASSRRGAQLLMRKGLRRARPLLGGLGAWVAAGNAVQGGA